MGARGRSLRATRIPAVLGALAAVTAAALTMAAAPQARAAAALGPLTTIDGPSSAIVGSLQMSIARDGSGGLVYVKSVGGTRRVFVSRLLGGFFGHPQQIDASLRGASSQPVIAAGNGGVLEVAFINAGGLYVVQSLGTMQALSAPGLFSAGASNPSIQMSNFGKAYLAFTVTSGNGHNVRAAYFNKSTWALEAAPLNVTPGDDSGTGNGRPQVGAAGDGVGVVAWGERGHVYTRRVWGTSPSVVTERADTAPAGCTEQSAGSPAVGVQGDSSYVAVAFQETVTCAGVQQQRVLYNRLHGSAYDGVSAVDGVGNGTADGATRPQVVTSEYGAGWIVSTRSGAGDANQIYATALGNNAARRGLTRVDSTANSGAPNAVTGTAGLFSNLIAWQQTRGSAGIPEIRVRFSPRSSLGPEMTLSSPTQGPTDAADGLAASGDVNGDGAVAWVQGAPGARAIVAAQLYQPPGSVAATKRLVYSRSANALLGWAPVKEAWRLSYAVTVDGLAVGQTTDPAFRTAPLLDGPHVWQVTASNGAGQSTVSRPATVFVDTIAPAVQFNVTGPRRINRRLRVIIADSDQPPIGASSTDASGLSKLTVNWSDHTLLRLGLRNHRSFHTYVRTGRYRVTVTATDKAGNVTRVTKIIKVKPKPKPKEHKKPPKPKTAKSASWSRR
jgi:PKD domain-containing protein